MKFNTPAGQNPIDRTAVIGQPVDRYEAKLKTTGTAVYAYEQHEAAPEVDHYHQPVALVVAESFEQARAATALIRVHYDRAPGRFDLEAERPHAPVPPPAEFGGPTETRSVTSRRPLPPLR